MKVGIRLALMLGSFATSLFLFQNCSKVAFTEDLSSLQNKNDGPTCRVDVASTTKNIKVLFVIDTSGSNASGGNGNQGTDLNKVWRLATINSFLNAYGAKSNFSFGFVTFQGTKASSLIMEGNRGVFSSSLSQANQAVAAFQQVPDKDNTPYDAALNAVKDMISYDQQKASSKDAAYVVVMVSDGYPTNSSYTNSTNGMSNLKNDVKSILAVAPGQTSLNTVFLYNQNIPGASQKIYLETIASEGGGVFVEASSQNTLNIADTVQVPKQVCD